jgi:hypothetical protein
MPGSLTTPGRSGTRIARPPVLPSAMTTASAPGTRFPFAARWLAYALPYRRFAAALADDDARLGADVDRYSFIATELHRLLLAGPCDRPNRAAARPLRQRDRHSR